MTFSRIANSVPPAIPISSPPLIRRATSVAVIANATTNVRIRSVVRSAAICSGGTGGAGTSVRVTMPAFTKPIRAMNRPIPIPMARFRSSGIAFMIATRRPVRTRIEITTPSITITPIACGHVSPSAPTSVKATKAFSPRPAAIANGYFAQTPMAMVITPATSAVTVSTSGKLRLTPS